ncbi:M20 aminoacylase family protein [Ochrobactrum sp. Marseille-Q0166]|uniref:M20 aminoacylase family protein n=1 Tax=Ochrobactrum sp. Marseille-Q0166 TaxID=2761105 RepID=UPI00165574E9|nr:M20 aminoacylase family protein [Ochrobactrum sp. Marseille-Q0166]MBC8719395.1 amidohydrolase [Ochrobactrum sp. Marseille-Q0166]
MPVIPFIKEKAGEMRAVFEDLHRHPEIGFEEQHASGVVAGLLEKWGFDEIHTGIAKTGVVGILKGRNPGNRRVGLRADMDALPIDEISGVSYTSQNPGRMHACGHDGHTTMLLGAAQYLAETRNFEGTAVFVFQPAEEGLGGARGMIAEGLFERFPCDEIYGMHNQPMGTLGKAFIRKGAAMAGASFFDIKLTGKGSHAAQPHNARDVLVIGADLVGQLQTIVSRNIPATDACVVSCTQFHTGSAYNIVPEVATITGTIRYFEQRVCDLAESRIREICAGVAAGYGITVDVDLRNVFDVLRNDHELSDAYMEAARDVLGEDNVSDDCPAFMGSEDFADMLARVPGAYINVMHGGKAALHNPAFVLEPETLPIGASIYARIVETRLPLNKDLAA